MNGFILNGLVLHFVSRQSRDVEVRACPEGFTVNGLTPVIKTMKCDPHPNWLYFPLPRWECIDWGQGNTCSEMRPALCGTSIGNTYIGMMVNYGKKPIIPWKVCRRQIRLWRKSWWVKSLLLLTPNCTPPPLLACSLSSCDLRAYQTLLSYLTRYLSFHKNQIRYNFCGEKDSATFYWGDKYLLHAHNPP